MKLRAKRVGLSALELLLRSRWQKGHSEGPIPMLSASDVSRAIGERVDGGVFRREHIIEQRGEAAKDLRFDSEPSGAEWIVRRKRRKCADDGSIVVANERERRVRRILHGDAGAKRVNRRVERNVDRFQLCVSGRKWAEWSSR